MDCTLETVRAGLRAANYVTTPRVETALCNCIGFGSKNSALVIANESAR